MPATIARPTISNAMSDLRGNTSLQATFAKLLLVGIVLFAAAAGLRTGNFTVLIGTGAGVAELFAELLILSAAFYVYPFVLFLWIWLRHGVDSATAWEMYFPKSDSWAMPKPATASEILILFGLPALTVFLSSFVFWSTGSPVYVVGHRTTGEKGILVGVPFIQRVQSVQPDYTVKVPTDAVTADDVKVAGTVALRVMISSDRDTILSIASSYPNWDKAIKANVKDDLQAHFRDAIKKRRFAELQQIMPVEYDVGAGINRGLLQKVGVHPEGTLQISDLHPYFGPR